VIVPYRDEDMKRHLKIMGDLGQIVPMVSQVVEGADDRNGMLGIRIRFMSA